ncbi:MAG: TPM domain-containing protein [Bacilli bacterium]|nr:TPM domain-containing protein [Bacilli bacterium]
MKKIIILLLAILLLPFSVLAEEENYVMIENTKLNQEVIDYINQYSSYLKKTINVRFYVYLSSEEKDEEFLKNLEQEIYTKYSGILLIGIKESGSIQVKVGNYISNRFSQKELDDILTDYGIKNIEKNNWNKAIQDTYIMIFKKYV